MNSSISRRLILWLSLPLVLLSLFGVIANYFIYFAPAITSSELRLEAAVNELTRRLRVINGKIILSTVSPNDSEASLADSSIKYVVRDAQGQMLGGDERLATIRPNGLSREGHSVVRVGNRNMRIVSRRMNTVVGQVDITAGELIARNQPMTRLSFISTLLLDFVRLDITLVFVWIGIRVGLRPLHRLRESIESRSSRDLRPVPESGVPQELAPLTVTINRLLMEVNHSVHAQQQFIANAAHQLRTPITGMIAQLDLVTRESAAEPFKDRLMILQDATRQLAHSVNQLLMLARADSAMTHIVRNQPVDLQAVANEIVAKFLDRAVAANIDLGVNTSSVWVVADVGLLDDLLSNLLDNALKYTAAKGIVTVNTGLESGEPFIEVDDNGRGIPAAERQRVRSRFYRCLDSPGHGSGLGLAIVDEIARLYNASLSIDTGSSGQGTRVRVQFPS